MHKIKEDFHRFLEEITENGVNERNIELAYMAAVGFEKVLKACVLDEEMDMEYHNREHSRDGGYSARRSYSRDSGHPYEEGGDSYRRDRMGRYSRDDGKRHMKEQTEIMMRQANTPQEKEMARRFMEMLDKT